MDNKDFLIQTKGRAVCLVLDTAIGLLNEVAFDAPSTESARQECVRELFYIITQVGSISCGYEEWTKVYDFLLDIGISVPEEFHLQMSYVDSMLDDVPGEMKCN